jgi:very-short-patch-repair endonuclease
MKLIAPAPGTNLAKLSYEYEAKPLLTEPEKRFFEVLERLSNDRVHIVCKPRLADFIQHETANGAFQKISQKHVDFLLCRAGDWMPMLAIEVDDASHRLAEQQKRDGFVNNLYPHIGLPLLRVGVREIDDLENLVKRLSDGWQASILQLGQA